MLCFQPDVRLTARHPTALLQDFVYLLVIWVQNKVVMLAEDTSPWGLRVPSPQHGPV